MPSRLLPKEFEAEYGAQIVDWAESSLEFFSDNNWHDGRCLGVYPEPPVIEVEAPGVISVRHDFSDLAKQATSNDMLPALRSRVLKLATRMAGSADKPTRDKLKGLNA